MGLEVIIMWYRRYRRSIIILQSIVSSDDTKHDDNHAYSEKNIRLNFGFDVSIFSKNLCDKYNFH